MLRTFYLFSLIIASVTEGNTWPLIPEMVAVHFMLINSMVTLESKILHFSTKSVKGPICMAQISPMGAKLAKCLYTVRGGD